MITTFSGVVIRSCNSGESDRIITVLCAEYGKVTVLAKGARKTGSKFMSSASLYCYSTFTVQKEEEISFLREADAHNTFFGLHNSLPAIALAGYACAVCEDVATQRLNRLDFVTLALREVAQWRAVRAILSGSNLDNNAYAKPKKEYIEPPNTCQNALLDVLRIWVCCFYLTLTHYSVFSVLWLPLPFVAQYR